jgi:hypothetical protein
MGTKPSGNVSNAQSTMRIHGAIIRAADYTEYLSNHHAVLAVAGGVDCGFSTVSKRLGSGLRPWSKEYNGVK